ncbi:MAG: hypothetical protein ACE5FH_04875, partial [Candidatus Zixiibacteriota bacterium]
PSKANIWQVNTVNQSGDDSPWVELDKRPSTVVRHSNERSFSSFWSEPIPAICWALSWYFGTYFPGMMSEEIDNGQHERDNARFVETGSSLPKN